jgi:hypothetical protein
MTESIVARKDSSERLEFCANAVRYRSALRNKRVEIAVSSTLSTEEIISTKMKKPNSIDTPGCQESPRSIPISAASKDKQTNSILCLNIFTAILNDRGDTAHPVPEDALYVINSEAIPHVCNRASISYVEVNSRSFRLPFNTSKSQKSHGLMSGE